MTDQLDTAAIRARSQQPGYLEGQALQDVHALCDALDAERRARAVMQANVRETWQALCTMRNHLNEHLPMPSLESDLLQGPENSVFCTAVAEAHARDDLLYASGWIDRIVDYADDLRAAQL